MPIRRRPKCDEEGGGRGFGSQRASQDHLSSPRTILEAFCDEVNSQEIHDNHENQLLKISPTQKHHHHHQMESPYCPNSMYISFYIFDRNRLENSDHRCKIHAANLVSDFNGHRFLCETTVFYIFDDRSFERSTGRCS